MTTTSAFAPPTAGERVVYILGAGHSGSTLLAMLLGGHPDVCTLGEVKALAETNADTYTCSCGQPLQRCAFWRRLSDELKAGDPAFELFCGPSDIRRAPSAYQRWLLLPLHRGRVAERLRDMALAPSPSWRAHRRRVMAFAVAVSREASKASNARVFIDSSKTGLQLKYLLKTPSLDVRVIRLARDARGVSLSYKKADRIGIVQAAHAWKRSNEEAAAVVKQLSPDRWFDLRYEDLCRDAGATLKRVFTFIGVDPCGAMAGAAGRPQHVLGNDRARLDLGALRLDEKWRHELTASDLASIDRVAGTFNRSLGYR